MVPLGFHWGHGLAMPVVHLGRHGTLGGNHLEKSRSPVNTIGNLAKPQKFRRLFTKKNCNSSNGGGSFPPSNPVAISLMVAIDMQVLSSWFASIVTCTAPRCCFVHFTSRCKSTFHRSVHFVDCLCSGCPHHCFVQEWCYTIEKSPPMTVTDGAVGLHWGHGLAMPVAHLGSHGTLGG